LEAAGTIMMEMQISVGFVAINNAPLEDITAMAIGITDANPVQVLEMVDGAPGALVLQVADQELKQEHAQILLLIVEELIVLDPLLKLVILGHAALLQKPVQIILISAEQVLITDAQILSLADVIATRIAVFLLDKEHACLILN
jgi:hypothetical protein